MKIKAFLFTIAIAVPSLALANDKTMDKPADKTADKTTDKTTDKSAAKISDDDLKVVSHVKHVNDMEIDMGKLAQSNGSAAVKKYGATLIKDHTTNNTKLTALGKKKGVTKIPDEMPATDADKAEHQQKMDAMAKLKTLKGVDFDKEFLTMMAADHDTEVSRIDSAMASVKDADVVAHLKMTKPVVQKHADTARELQAKTTTSMK